MLVSLADAAKMLGFSTEGLRRIVDRSRDQANGRSTSGPVIRFFQPGSGAEIKFRQEWIDQFIEENTVDPARAAKPHTQRRKQVKLSRSTTPVTPSLLDSALG